MTDNKILTFGGYGGVVEPIKASDINGRNVQIWCGRVIDSIRIDAPTGKKRYGGEGGELKASFPWPSDGILELKSLFANQYRDFAAVSYISFRAGENVISVGDTNSPYRMTCDLLVKLTGVRHGDYIDSLQFEVTALPS